VSQGGSLTSFTATFEQHRGVDLRYFTTLTTLGTPHDVTAQERRLEGYFPLDQATRKFAEGLGPA
jgi:hypothetical protein